MIGFHEIWCYCLGYIAHAFFPLYIEMLCSFVMDAKQPQSYRFRINKLTKFKSDYEEVAFDKRLQGERNICANSSDSLNEISHDLHVFNWIQISSPNYYICILSLEKSTPLRNASIKSSYLYPVSGSYYCIANNKVLFIQFVHIFSIELFWHVIKCLAFLFDAWKFPLAFYWSIYQYQCHNFAGAYWVTNVRTLLLTIVLLLSFCKQWNDSLNLLRIQLQSSLAFAILQKWLTHLLRPITHTICLVLSNIIANIWDANKCANCHSNSLNLLLFSFLFSPLS